MRREINLLPESQSKILAGIESGTLVSLDLFNADRVVSEEELAWTEIPGGLDGWVRGLRGSGGREKLYLI